MNINHSYPTIMYESILAQTYVFLVILTLFGFYHETFLKQKLQKKKFFYQKYVHLGENTLIHFSQITIVHIHVNVFL